MFHHVLTAKQLDYQFIEAELKQNGRSTSIYQWKESNGVFRLCKDNIVLWTRELPYGCSIGMRCDNANCKTRQAHRQLYPTFCIDTVICHDNVILHENGEPRYKLPHDILGISAYDAFPWLLLDNNMVFNVQSRIRMHVDMGMIHGDVAMVREGSTLVIRLKYSNRVLFVHHDVSRKLSALLGKLPMDALNEVYRFIKM